MADTEEYFPRGGKKPTTKFFKQSNNFLGTAEKSEKKKKKPKKKSEGDDGYLSDEISAEYEQSIKNCAVGINYQTVKEGTVILGRVRRVLETKLQVSLPCRMQGTVMACHISEPYNKLLEAYVNDQVESVRELSKMFRPGQYVTLKVLEVEDKNLMMSLMPQHVNAGRLHSGIQKGALFQAAVSSVEDHGYVMDLGIPNTTAFLPTKNANQDLEYDVGMVSWCYCDAVTPSPGGSIVSVGARLSGLQGALCRTNTAPIPPAAQIEFTVDKALDNGIEGRILGGTTAYIQRAHTDSVKGKKPALGQKIRARLLYVLPTRKTPFLTMKSIFSSTYPDLEEEQKYKVGELVEDAQVIKITRRSVVFKLGRRSVGMMTLKRIDVDEDATDEQMIAKSYPPGSEHKVRILHYNLCDYCYSVSDQPEALSQRYFCLEQLSVGQCVDATVNTVTGNSVTLQVGRCTGFVTPSHLADSGLSLDRKRPVSAKLTKKKYKVGQEVRARILSVDLDTSSLILTLKPSLLAPDLEVLQSYEGAAVGKAYTGVIKYIKDFLIVSFFNNVVAFVPKVYVSREPIDNLADAFHIGQIVNCTILKVDVESKKMSGSLTTEPFWPAKKRDNTQKRKQKTEDDDDIPGKKQKTSEDDDKSVKKQKTKKKDEEVDRVAQEIEEVPAKSKKDKKRKATKDTNENEMQETEVLKKSDKTTKKKDKLKNKDKVTQETEEEPIKKKKDKKSKTKDTAEETQKPQVSEESDAIETDFQSDSDQILTPQDMFLIDMSDCTTQKKYKKRIVSLLKAFKARTRRLDVIEKKIQRIEEEGLDRENKKYHTAMHSEKLVIEERVRLLLEALKTAQDKLKDFPSDDTKEYKKKKEIKAAKKEESKPDGDVKEDAEKKLLEKLKGIKIVDSNSKALDLPSVKDFWSDDVDTGGNVAKEEESSSSEEEEKDVPKKKRKKLSAAEKVAKAREEENRLRKLEREAIEGGACPRSVEQFERALLASPDCSRTWLAYCAMHLQATEIEKARAVCRRALNTISFREEQERLNVWLGWLNLENRFGTKESQQKTLEEAIQTNDTFSIHSKLLDIYVDTSKLAELSSLIDLMMRKYKKDPQTFILCGGAAYKLGMVEKARQVMQKAISVLEKKEHVTVLVQFALMERTNGDSERSEALFEQILGVYPQRVDVCAVYVDMLYKSGDTERVRQVMERMTSQKLPARKMKVLYKKWIEIEEKIGEKDQIDRIRQKAMEFIENAKF